MIQMRIHGFCVHDAAPGAPEHNNRALGIFSRPDDDHLAMLAGGQLNRRDDRSALFRPVHRFPYYYPAHPHYMLHDGVLQFY